MDGQPPPSKPTPTQCNGNNSQFLLYHHHHHHHCLSHHCSCTFSIPQQWVRDHASPSKVTLCAHHSERRCHYHLPCLRNQRMPLTLLPGQATPILRVLTDLHPVRLLSMGAPIRRQAEAVRHREQSHRLVWQPRHVHYGRPYRHLR